MKRLLAGVCLILGAGLAGADDLADAAKALSGKNYPQALATYTRLANAGNAEAALRLGEMYWYGDGAPLDRAKGDALFTQAAAAGNKEGVAATGLSRQRQQRLADISHWTNGYDGADLTAGKLNCVAPGFPAYSSTKPDVRKVSDTYDAYAACYHGFIENLASKRLPEDVAMLMSEQELGQAREHLGKVIAATAARGKQVADQTLARREEWVKQTMEYLTTTKLRRDGEVANIERNSEISRELRASMIKPGPAAPPPGPGR
jgi:TPR repeat protein